MKHIISLLTGMAALFAGTANAQLVEEFRAGVMAHNICVTDCKNADKEDGQNVQGEFVFASPGVFRYIFSPRPYVMGSVNTAGETSFGAIGLVWNWDFAPGWSFEPSLGYAIHNGETRNPFVTGTPAAAAFGADNLLLGSEDLFRTGLALNRDFGENWGGQILYEHLSHGQILGTGRNQGLDSLGVRVYWRFDG